MKPTVSYLTLTVSDLEASLKFYGDGLGLGPWRTLGMGMAAEAGGQVLVLHPRPQLSQLLEIPDASLDGHGVLLSHNVDRTDDVDRITARLVENGGRLLRLPKELAWGDYGACVADPDGHPWEIVHSPAPTKQH